MNATLPTVRPVFVKELARALGLCEATVLRRMRRFDRNPSDPLAIPYLRKLGRPYRTTREVADRLRSVGGVQ